MPQTPHVERHFTAGEVVRDVVIGMSDGLTVPFALAAGLSGAVDNSHIVVVAGLAEIAAGSIAMGLGGYLAARGDAEHYESERRREVREVEEIPDEEAREVHNVFTSFGLSPQESDVVVQSLTKRPQQWVDFMMRFELGLEEPDPKRAVQSAATIAGSYVAGGIIPLSPYMLMHSSRSALGWSVSGHSARFGRLRLHQRPLHRHPPAPLRPANRGHRRNRRRRRLPAGKSVLLEKLHHGGATEDTKDHEDKKPSPVLDLYPQGAPEL